MSFHARSSSVMGELRHARPEVRTILWLATASAYFGVSWATARVGLVDHGVPLLVPAAGIAFSAVQLGSAWLATALAVAGFGEGLRQGLSPAAALLLGAAAAGTGLAGRLLTNAVRLPPAGERVADTVVRVTGSFAAAFVGATLSFASLAVAGGAHDGAELWAVLLLAHLAGILVVSPFVRAWIQRGSRGVARAPERVALAVLACVIVSVAGFGVTGTAAPSVYLVFPIVVWAALRAGRMGVSATLLVAALTGAGNAAAGRGIFDEPSALQTALRLDSFLVVLALTGLLLAGLELERHVAAVGLTEAEERHRRLLEQLPLVTYTRALEPHAPPYEISQKAVDLLGYPPEAWLAEPHFAAKLVHPDDADRHAELNERSMTEDLVIGEYRMVRADGRVIWILDHMMVLRNEAGEPVAQQGFVVDVTERKQLEEQLRRAQRLEGLGLLAGGIAHDFNNLLTAISGYTQLALEHADADPDLLRRDIAEVGAAAGRAAELTRQLLAFARQQVLERTVVDLNTVVEETEQMLARVIGENIEVVTRLDPGLHRVRADVGQLSQVIVNLTLNARDAMPEGGTLTIETRNERLDDDGDYALLVVSDTGVGMDETTREQIFEPFFTTKGVGEGTGLGLAMVYGIVQQSGGRVSVDSAPGRGSTFRVAFPRTDEASAAPEVGRAPAGGGSETILLVEDEAVVRRLTAEMLERQGYRVVVAGGPDEALAVEEHWDLLLTDVVMPSMSGPELAQRLLEGRPDAGVLFTSGYSGPAVAGRVALGAELLEKPFTLDDLTHKVRTALDARSGR